MIDHAGVAATDIEKSRVFYEKALAPLGYVLMKSYSAEQTGRGPVVGFGVPPMPDFWLSEKDAKTPVHIALRASNRAMVDAFHAAAIAAGGRDNGKPGVRVHYHENYYGAFVLDLDGNNIEACCHTPG